MNCASILAADCTDCKVRIPKIESADIQRLRMRLMPWMLIEPLTSFVLPGGHPVVSVCHVCEPFAAGLSVWLLTYLKKHHSLKIL